MNRNTLKMLAYGCSLVLMMSICSASMALNTPEPRGVPFLDVDEDSISVLYQKVAPLPVSNNLKIINSPSEPIPITGDVNVVNLPDVNVVNTRKPFSISVDCGIVFDRCDEKILTIPVGKKAVIEYLSCSVLSRFGGIRAGDTWTCRLIDSSTQFYLPSIQVLNDTNFMATGQQVKINIESHHSVKGSVFYPDFNPNSSRDREHISVFISISGFFEDE